LQDRTQFSDRDLATLKKYWDNGMTSLGSVCREKIEAVAAELNVDCEIVRTNEALQNEEIGHKDDDQNPVSTDNVKIEILDDEESDLISNSEVDQMSSLLDYKTFTRSLILAIKSDDKEQQQALLSDLPPELEEMDFNHTSPEPDDTSFSLSSLSEKNASDSL
ncbi:hypothetical protein Nmel_012939, partial [Mimus melanotis]